MGKVWSSTSTTTHESDLVELNVNEETIEVAEKTRELTEKETKKLSLAIIHGKCEEAKSIISIMNDIDLVLPKNGHTALHLSCKYGRTEIVKYLIKFGANVNKIDNSGFSLLMKVVEYGKVEIFQILINAGANINYSNVYGESVLSQTTILNKFEMFEILISSGLVDIDKCGGVALICSCSTDKNINIVKKLIELNVNVNYGFFSTGFTALHYACRRNNLKFVELLMENNADESIQNINGKIPIEMTNNEEIKEFINNYKPSKFVLK